MNPVRLNNFELNRKAFGNVINGKRNKKSGKRLYVSAIHKRLNKSSQPEYTKVLVSDGSTEE